ncbi:MAG: GtrA family protein [Bacteroidota bacterium]
MKFKFALSSSVATIVDNVLYNVLVYYFFTPVISNIISYATGTLINFVLQKKYIFDLNRKLSTAFMLSLLVSMGGLALSTLFIYLLNKIEFFNSYQVITKIVVTGIVFFYNFYLKRFAFEKRFV